VDLSQYDDCRLLFITQLQEHIIEKRLKKRKKKIHLSHRYYKRNLKKKQYLLYFNIINKKSYNYFKIGYFLSFFKIKELFGKNNILI